jgi:hypothetical protein
MPVLQLKIAQFDDDFRKCGDGVPNLHSKENNCAVKLWHMKGYILSS